jgi:hypothetical protein
MSFKNPLTFADLPFYASDEMIGEAVLGYERRKEFKGLATLMENHGLPKIDVFWGGRCSEAVHRFLLSDYGAYGLGAPRGVEGSFVTKPRQKHKRRPFP